MLTSQQEDEFIEQASAKLEYIDSAESIRQVYQQFQSAVKIINDLGLQIANEITEDDFIIPEDDSEVEFVVPLYSGEDESELYFIFNYSIENGIYTIFTDVDFYVDVEEQGEE